MRSGWRRCSLLQNDIVTHQQTLPHKDVAAAIEAGARLEVGAVCLQAGVRGPGVDGGAVRLTTSDEIDAAGRVWTMPGARMKAKREHRIPLCGRAVNVLNTAHTFGDDNRLDAHWRLGRSGTATACISRG